MASASVVATPIVASPVSTVAGRRPIELNWGDLIPEEAGGAQRAFEELAIVQHGELLPRPDQEHDAALTTAFDGALVKMPGFALPIGFDPAGVTEFILTPYIGACLHVPPPPPNQLVIVELSEPTRLDDVFEPVFVTGEFYAAVELTMLADIGYRMYATEVEPFSPNW